MFCWIETRGRHRHVRVSRTRRRRSNGAGIGRIARRTYDYFLYVVSSLPLRSTRVRRQHSPLSLLCITMILRVRRNFFEITTFPNTGLCLTWERSLRIGRAELVKSDTSPGLLFGSRQPLDSEIRSL